MRLPHLLLSAAFAAALHAAAPEAAPAPQAQSDADRDWAALKSPVPRLYPENVNELPESARRVLMAWMDLTMRDRMMTFIENHPDDPRRWQLVHRLPGKLRIYGGWDAEGQDGLQPVLDESASAAWAKKVGALKQAMLTAPDLPETLRRELAEEKLLPPLDAAVASLAQDGSPANFAAVRAQIDDLCVRVTNENVAALVYIAGQRYLQAFGAAFPDRMDAELAHFAASPNQALADAAARWTKADKLQGRTLEVRFTAIDGREVDLAQLRGKVVLVDFWATWCRPCLAELPTVKKVYADYHDKGFEVIGIAQEIARFQPGDTPEQKTAKLERVKKTLLAFTTKQQMPWPQCLDCPGTQGGISERYGITSLPAMLLIDQDGKVVSTKARGEKLEAEVKRLLKL